MSAAVKMPLIRIEVREGKKRKFYQVSKKTANAVEALLVQLSSPLCEHISASELFPDLDDPQKTPGIALRGIRLRLDLTQKEMAEKIGIDQGDISKIEKGDRLIGKTLALRIGKALGVDYRRFL